LNNRQDPNSFPSLISNMELDIFREKTNQLMYNLENNDLVAALKCINEINEITGKNFYEIIGKLTRGLHNAVSDLNYVISLTDDAAKKTLDMTENSMVIIRSLAENNSEQKSLIENYLAVHSPDEETSTLLHRLTALGQYSETKIAQVNINITEIVVAQNFQDIASQSITKAINIIKEVENSLVVLTQYANLLTNLSRFTEQAKEGLKPEDSEAIKSDIGQLNCINESEHLNQNDVDNLLSSLGF